MSAISSSNVFSLVFTRFGLLTTVFPGDDGIVFLGEDAGVAVLEIDDPNPGNAFVPGPLAFVGVELGSALALTTGFDISVKVFHWYPEAVPLFA